ncbi:SDR family NAD(P)-dependent oxidoreductase [Novosphingobium aerophilum]|uniref:Short-chain dehydrogenase n=1 Tax=Novosphingobium pentaromativorans TaxID=205844 RepID=A0A2W5NMD7_9SPHN|nr:SDR family oxidoreductase [Novosphingobium sp. TCA1]PZQ53658.1 MAG: short-chain dehydrogenase [Novosphingobium pentaromativorans]GFE75718.1 putative short-chain type dehydrogenase/reductase [Novosphingobium sp. TCA1]
MIDLSFPLRDKVALVTGGGSGIGRATARMFAQRGAMVAVAGLDEAPLLLVAEEIVAAGGQALPIVMDVTSEDAIAGGVARLADRFGRLDILHSNAAQTGELQEDGLIDAMDADFWDRTFSINLRGSMLCAKHAIPLLLTSGGGSIIFTGSGKGLAGDLDYPAYGTSKAALLGLSRYIATQYGKQGIRSNVVVVGLAMTEALDRNMPEAAQKLMTEHNLVDHLGRPEDIAEVVAFLASEQSRYITGAAIVADGGFTSHSAVYADMLRFAAMDTGAKA